MAGPATRRRFAAFFVIASGLVAPVRAESLQELYDAARAYDATYLAARAQADSVPYRVEQARSLNRPSVNLSATGGRSTSDTPSSDLQSRSVNAGISALQPLFNRVNDKTIAQSEKSLDVAAADLQLAEQDLIVRVAQAYFDVLGAQDTLAAARANKTAIAEQLASAKRNFEVGTATITDTREAQARFDLATAQEIVADNDLRTKRIALDVLVGRNGVQPNGLIAPVRLPPVTPTNVDDWVGQTDSAPNVRKASLAYDVARLETEKARAQALPTVDLSGNYSNGWGRTRGDQSSGGFTAPVDLRGNSNSSSVALTLRMPLYAGHAIQNRIRETLQLEDQSRNTLDASRRAVAQATRQAFFGVQSLLAQVIALEAAESSSQLALEATQVGYRVGVRVNIDVLNAQTQLFTTRRDLARARYDVLVNGLRLRQSAGQLQPSDVTAVDALLQR